MGLWILAQGFPLVPSFRRTQLFASWGNLQHLSATWPEMGVILASFLALAMLVSQPRWVAIAFLILPAQFVILQRIASPGKMSAALVGWLLATLLRRSRAGWAAGWLVLAWVMADELRPFRFVGSPQVMTFLPGEGVFFTAEPYLVSVATKLFLFVACLLLFKRMGHGLLAPAVGLCLFIALGEWLQRYLPGRTPETTDPLLVLLAAGLLAVTIRKPISDSRSRP